MLEKHAVLSMDIEDWYHLDYFDASKADRSYSMLDGLDRYCQILVDQQVPSSFFVLSDQIPAVKGRLRELVDAGHDIASHGAEHRRPLTVDPVDFQAEVDACRKELEDLTGNRVLGYRAPCFSLDRERLDILREVGFKYDSSRILFGGHPLYGDLDVRGFEEVRPSIYRLGDFIEFQVSTLAVAGKQIPVSGGGYLRILPWFLTHAMLVSYLRLHSLYVLYIHPFELSGKGPPFLPADTSLSTRLRFGLGRRSVASKLERLLAMLRDSGFQFTTFARMRTGLLGSP